MKVLGIESSCDETACAIVEDGRTILSNVVATQIPFHKIYKGVVPEIASRKHAEWILPVVRQALKEANMTLDQVDAIAATNRPGLMGSLLVGFTFGKTLAWATNKPFRLTTLQKLRVVIPVAFRCPGDKWLREIITLCSAPIFSTSVNRSGQPVLDTSAAISSEFAGEVNLIIDNGDKKGALPSTLVMIENNQIKVLRQGSVQV